MARILYIVSEDWYFCSHRLPLAAAAMQRGHDVAVATRVHEHGDKIMAAGLRLIPLKMVRRGKNPFKEISSIWELYLIVRAERPDIVHLVALKPIVYGGIAARLAGLPHVVTSIAGLGHVFTSRQFKAKLFRPVSLTLLRVLLNRQNVQVYYRTQTIAIFSCC